MASSDDTAGGADTARSELVIKGELNAEGWDESQSPTVSSPITFTSDAEASKKAEEGDWYGIEFEDSSVDWNPGTSTGSVVDNCKIKYAFHGISCDPSAPMIRNNLITHNFGSGINLDNS